MAFKFKDFEKALLKDNPKYERVLKSDLHDLVELLKDSANPNQTAVLKEMKKIKKDKWKKYEGTLEYLYEAFPDLKPAVVNFKTKSLSAGPSGAIVHVLSWESSTGDMDDIAHIRVREHVSWDKPDTATVPYVLGEYAKSGHHYGQGNAAFTPGNVGRGDDTHLVNGPFMPKVFEFKGPGVLKHEMAQVYEMSEDGGKKWEAIPKSAYKIIRTVSFANDEIKFSIAKGGGAGEKIANAHSIPVGKK